MLTITRDIILPSRHIPIYVYDNRQMVAVERIACQWVVSGYIMNSHLGQFCIAVVIMMMLFYWCWQNRAVFEGPSPTATLH